MGTFGHMNDSELEFKPLSDGLGFHPFSNGMPYSARETSARPTTPKSQSGTGAVSAGAPRFVYTPRVAVPVMTPSGDTRMEIRSASTSASLPSLALPSTFPRTTSAPAPAITPLPNTAAPTARRFETTQSGVLALRLLAYFVDSCIHFLFGFFALTALAWREPVAQDLVSSDFIGIAVVFLLVLNWALVSAQEVVFKTSFGKRLLGLTLQNSQNSNFAPSPLRILMRAILFVPSVALFGLGLIWGAFDSERRCLHDRVSGVGVVRL